MNVGKNERAVLNTTIDKGVYDGFKHYCRQRAIPMNLILELFMKQFIEGHFDVKLTKSKVYLEFSEE